MNIDFVRSELDLAHKQICEGLGGSVAIAAEQKVLYFSTILDSLQESPIRITPKQKYRCTAPYRKLLSKQTSGAKKVIRTERRSKNPLYPA
jgi:hypothetical protein